MHGALVAYDSSMERSSTSGSLLVGMLLAGAVGCQAEENCACLPPVGRVTVTSSVGEMVELSMSGKASRGAVVTCTRAGVATGCRDYEVLVIEGGPLSVSVRFSDGRRRTRDIDFVTRQEDACCSALVRVGPSQEALDMAPPDLDAGRF